MPHKNNKHSKLIFQTTIHKIKTPELLLRVCDYQPTKFIIITPKKNIKLATQRNLCKRIIKEYYQTKLSTIINQSLIITTLPLCSQLTKNQLREALNQLYKQVTSLSNES